MAVLILMCGLPCSGKTTLAKRLEREFDALRLTPDEWITTVHGSSPDKDVLDAAREPFEALQWEVATRALELGVNVVLDFGFWGQSEREHFRVVARDLGASSEIRYLDVPLDVLLARLEKRNAELPSGTFHISPDEIHKWWDLFERPTAEECVRRELI